MSKAEEIQNNEEEKKEILPESKDNEKSNMKITIIPRVLISQSPNEDPSPENNSKETPMPKNEDNIKDSNKIIMEDEKEEPMLEIPPKEEKLQEIPKKECEKEEEKKMEIEPEDKKEEEKIDPEKKEGDTKMKIENDKDDNQNAKKDDGGWGIDFSENKNNGDGWGNANANQENNNGDGWGNPDTKQENNNRDGWGNPDSKQENKSGDGWGSSDNAQENAKGSNNQDWGNNANSTSNPNMEALANEMQQADDKDIREDNGPLPEAKSTEDTFALCEEKKDSKVSWFNRDGRNNQNDPFIAKEEKKLLEEHDNYAARKEDKTSLMESLEFQAYYVKIYSDEPPQQLSEKKRPKIRFDNMNKLPGELAKNVKRLKFDYLTPIQRMVMPYIQVGKDIVCIAETGSGKTVAYLFPIIGQMLITGVPENPFLNDKEQDKKENKEENAEDNNNSGEKKKSYFSKKKAYPLCLILVPTRELAIQVAKESKKLSFNTGIRTVAIYGGDMKKFQLVELNKGCDIMVATPGRLIDLIEKDVIDLKMVKYLIMDEADRMLDQNFYEDIKNIISRTTKRKDRQNLLFSATFNEDIKGLAKYFLNNYYYFKPVLESPKQIKHEFIRVHNDDDKKNALINFLKKDETKDKSVLIFLRTKNGVDELGRILKEENIPCCTIHGDKIQADRIRSIAEFSSGKKNVLIATDVASRGLDFPSVYCVVNFDLPQTNDDYIHRVGRTGRIGQEGKALTFIDGMDEINRMKLVHFLKNQGQEVPEWIDDSISQRKYRFFAANKRKIDDDGNDGNNKDNSEKDNKERGFKKPFKKRNNDDDNNSGKNNNESSWNNNDGNNNSSWGGNNDNNNAGSSWDNENKKETSSWGNSNNNNSGGWGSKENNKGNNDSWGSGSKNDNGWGSNDNSNDNNLGWDSNDNNKETNSGWGSKDKININNDNDNSGWGSNDNNNSSWDNNKKNDSNNFRNSNNDNRGRGRGRDRGRGRGGRGGRGGRNFDRNNNSNSFGNSNNDNHSNDNVEIPDNAFEELFVKGISYESTEDDLRDAFSKYGDIVQAKILKDKETQKSKGIGFVKFSEKKSAVIALNDADNITCQGRNLMMKFSNDKEGELKGKKGGKGGGFKGGFNKGNRNKNENNNTSWGNNNDNDNQKGSQNDSWGNNANNNNNDSWGNNGNNEGNSNNFWGKNNNEGNNDNSWGNNNKNENNNSSWGNKSNENNNNFWGNNDNDNNKSSWDSGNNNKSSWDSGNNNENNSSWNNNDDNKEDFGHNNFNNDNRGRGGRGRGRGRGNDRGRGGRGGRGDRGGRGRGDRGGRGRGGRGGFRKNFDDGFGSNNNENNNNNSWGNDNGNSSNNFNNNDDGWGSNSGDNNDNKNNDKSQDFW